MPIGTAVPSLEERQGVPHHMLERCPPTATYSVADYCRDASVCIEGILARKHLPIVAGGTGLYLDALLRGAVNRDLPGPAGLREALRRRAEGEGGAALLAELAQVDPETAARLHPNDLKRILRALEVFAVSGQPLSALARQRTADPPYEVRWFAIGYADRALLYERIDRRVDLMVEQGLLDEVRRLLQTPGIERGTAIQAIGYKELAQALTQGGDLAQGIAAAKQATRRYAKRQLTWLRRHKDLHWFHRDRQSDREILANMINLTKKDN